MRNISLEENAIEDFEYYPKNKISLKIIRRFIYNSKFKFTYFFIGLINISRQIKHLQNLNKSVTLFFQI